MMFTGTMFCFLFLPDPPDAPLLGVLVLVSFMNPPPDWLEFHMVWLLGILGTLCNTWPYNFGLLLSRVNTRHLITWVA